MSDSKEIKGGGWVITYILAAAASYIGAFLTPTNSGLLVYVYLALTVHIIADSESMKKVVLNATILGTLTIVPTLSFFWVITGPRAIPLWIMLIAWQTLAAMLSRLAIDRLEGWGYAICPVILITLLYARCELYPLRFAMSTPINALEPIQLYSFGYGGFGYVFISTTLAVIIHRRQQIVAWLTENGSWPAAGTALFLLPAALGLIVPADPAKVTEVEVVGIPLEAGARGLELQFFPVSYLLQKLDDAAYYHPGGQLFVLPEYAIAAEPSQAIRQWCKRQGVYLILGGRKYTDNGSFTNTAFVINPKGEIEFSQGKVQPIQTAPDGLPALEQKLWHSPWGKIGIAICYDLTFTRVCDALVRQGAQAIICPAMDLQEWGVREHDLNARFARIRAAEYSIPVLRVVSSGPSELVGKKGLVNYSNGWTGQSFEGILTLGHPGLMPADRLFLGLLPSLVRTPRAG